jgi:hypothetical protein
MKFTEKQILEIKKIIVDENIDLKFKINKSYNEITLNLKLPNITLTSYITNENNVFYFKGIKSDYKDFEYLNISFNNLKSYLINWIRIIKLENPFLENINENVKKLSPKFYPIFNEAKVIENLGFQESAGMLYRKVLEILVKDFLIKILPEKENLILNNTIGAIIKDFYSIKDNELNTTNKEKHKEIFEKLENLKSLFKIISNTFQIGNDFSHYERRLLSFYSSDMKKNIYMIIDYINLQIEEEKINDKKNVLNKSFDTELLIDKNVNNK